MELATVPNSKTEMRAYLRWRMQQQVGYSLSETLVLYQVYSAAGSSPTVLAAFVQSTVLQQYINVCRAAGLLPVSIGISMLHLLDWFKQDIAGVSNSFFAVCNEKYVAVVALRSGQPVYLRSKPIRSAAMAIDELTATLQYYFGQYPDRSRLSADHEPVLFFADSTATVGPQLDRDGTRHFSVRDQPTDPWIVRLVPLDAQTGDSRAGGEANLAAMASVAPPQDLPIQVAARLPWDIWKACTGTRSAQYLIRQIHLGFDLTDIARARMAQWSMIGAMLTGFCLTGWWWWSSVSLNDLAEKYERATTRTQEVNQLAVLQMKQDGLVLAADELRIVDHDIAFVTQLETKRTFLWTRLLTDLESTLPEPVTLLSVTPQLNNGNVGLHGTAKTLHDLHAFVSKLQKHPAFHRVTLSNHSLKEASTSQEAGRRLGQDGNPDSRPNSHVEFSLTADYQPVL